VEVVLEFWLGPGCIKERWEAGKRIAMTEPVFLGQSKSSG
jgi:hypothetical protein